MRTAAIGLISQRPISGMVSEVHILMLITDSETSQQETKARKEQQRQF
jgi:hypothetical protein